MIAWPRAAVIAGLACVATRPVAAEPDELTPGYFVDRDALLYFWAPVFGTVVVHSFVPSRDTPWLHEPDEGGAESRKHRELPNVLLTAGGALVVGGIALGDDPSRYHHAKGLAQSLATSGFVTVGLKRVFGRHRPDFDPADTTDEDARRSFPSGHATRAWSTLTYTALYLHHHGFDQWRDAGTLPWWEVATHVGLGALAIGLSAERVVNNRHHVTDVIAGGVVGAATSLAFFYYQESRYDGARASPAAAPSPSADGPMLSFGGAF